MSETYQPPFHMTEEITNLIVEIGQYVGSITIYETMHQNPVLRRENRIRSIHSSLAIEQNTLSLNQVTDIIQGKRVLGPLQDIREVKNAYEAYEQISGLDSYSVKDLLLAHKWMMEGLVKDVGQFRSGNVGVYAGEQLIHAGTPARYVPELVSQLMTWLKESRYHPLVKSCIFHYEFEFIHPFADGNGRTGRVWQSLILQKWNDLFAWLPIETLVHENQEKYYRMLQKARSADSFSLRKYIKPTVLRNYISNFYDTGRNIDAVQSADVVLVVDDFGTTGSTIRELIRNIRKINHQCEIYVFTLMGNKRAK